MLTIIFVYIVNYIVGCSVYQVYDRNNCYHSRDSNDCS